MTPESRDPIVGRIKIPADQLEGSLLGEAIAGLTSGTEVYVAPAIGINFVQARTTPTGAGD